jgi:hypothetical protein
MKGFIGSYLQLQSIIKAHTLNSFWTTSVWRISPKNLSLPVTDFSESEPYVTTDGQSAGLSWNKAPILALLSDSCGFVDVGRSLWREDGSVVYNCCWSSPAQSFSSPSPVALVTIFNVSDLRLPFSSPPMIRRATVEVFDPASTREWLQCTNELHFITSTGIEYKSPSQKINYPLLICLLSRECLC